MSSATHNPKQIHRLFLVVEGDQDGYPNYEKNLVHILENDPCEEQLDNLFICSPLFSPLSKGVEKIPELNNKYTITFLMVPNIFPTISDIIQRFSFTNEIWFSLGLANLVVIEEGRSISTKLIEYLRSKDNLTAFETWDLKDNKIKKPVFQIEHPNKGIEHCGIQLSDKLPLNIKFSVSEFVISIDKFLTASKKFTPQYYDAHKKTIEVATKRLINDLSFIHGDMSFSPSNSIIKSLGKTTLDEVKASFNDDNLKEKKEEIINDRHGRLIQFNSSMSYLYSQGYAGTFPIFDHIGIIRRHSLLGIGSAISALFELVAEIEGAFVFLPFDDFDLLEYPKNNVPENYLSILSSPSKYNSGIWDNDIMIEKLAQITTETSKKAGQLTKPSNFYNRLAFYSGRLGFREYDFSATAAIQVLVEAHSLEYNVINYTHEIIHNHVRTILNRNLINIPTSLRSGEYVKWLESALQFLDDLYHERVKDAKLNYKEYFIILLINYCINSEYYGSLSKEMNATLYEKRRTTYDLPTGTQLKELIKQQYKDINEIFVHIIDFSYIYKRDIKAYCISIWASWSTVPSVTSDLRQYIVRTLITIGVTTSGSMGDRYNEAKRVFQELIPELKNHNNAFVFENINSILLEQIDDDLYYRFCNCIIIADLAYRYFVGYIDLLLDNNDPNILESMTGTTTKEDEGPIDLYDAETGEFSGITIKSKTRFLLDQLIREIRRTDKNGVPDQEKERISSWLLLSLSSYNKS